jgi:hypothetical protein
MLRRGNDGAKQAAPTTGQERAALWAKRLDRFLTIACEAEGGGDYCRAARAFVLALLCDGRLRPGRGNCWKYVFEAMPVY